MLGPDYHLFKALWDAAPAGAVVHRVKSDDPQLVGDGLTENDAIAFTHNNKTTVLLINANPHVKSVTLGGLSTAKSIARVTTKDSNLAPLEIDFSNSPSNNRIELKLPPRSIVVLTEN